MFLSAFASLIVLSQPMLQAPTYAFKAGEKFEYLVGFKVDGNPSLMGGKLFLETRMKNPNGSWDLYVDTKLGVIDGGKINGEQATKGFYVVDKNMMVQKIGAGTLPLIEQFFLAVAIPGSSMPGSKMKQTTEYSTKDNIVTMNSKLSGADLSGTVKQEFDTKIGKITKAEVYLKTSKGGVTYEIELVK
jgi:hypothetical protein